MSNRITSVIGILAAAAISVTAATAQTPSAEPIRIGYQKSSTLTAILKTNGALEKALAPLGIRVSWHEFTWRAFIVSGICFFTSGVQT
jgi:sulfonate transport system substrate-binding protein